MNKNDSVVLAVHARSRQSFREISLANIEKIVAEADLRKRRWLVIDLSIPKPISDDSQVDFEVVVEGEDAEESWQELQGLVQEMVQAHEGA